MSRFPKKSWGKLQRYCKQDYRRRFADHNRDRHFKCKEYALAKFLHGFFAKRK